MSIRRNSGISRGDEGPDPHSNQDFDFSFMKLSKIVERAYISLLTLSISNLLRALQVVDLTNTKNFCLPLNGKHTMIKVNRFYRKLNKCLPLL